MGESASKSGDGFTVMKGLAVNAFSAMASGLLQVASGVASFVKDSIGAAGSFEAGMNTFSAAAGVGAEELDAFKQQFIDLGKELPVSTKEVQDAATAMVKGGIEPAVVAGGALRDTLQFAAAAGMGLEKAADLTAKQLGTFTSITATAAEKTAFMAMSQEMLVKAANASTVDVEQLGEAMLMAGGSAKAAGVSYEDFVTTMGAISGAFPTAATAGTSFNNFLTRMIPATNTAKDAMAELGLLTEEGNSKFYDAQGQFIGMANAAQLLQDAFATLTPAQRSEAMATIFGNDAKNAAIALMDLGAAGMDKFALSMQNANGITGQAAATQTGFNFAMTNMQGSVEALQITLGTALLPILTQVVGSMTGMVNAAIGVVDAIFDAGVGSTEFSESLGLLDAALGLTDGTLAGWYASLMAGVAQLQAFGVEAQAVGAQLMTALQPAIAAIAGFVITTLVPALTMLWNWLAAQLPTAIALITAYWNGYLLPVITLVSTFIAGTLVPALTVLFEWLMTNLPTALATLTTTWNTQLLPAITAVSAFVTGTLVPAFNTVWAFISDTLLPILEDLATLGFNKLKADATAFSTFFTTTLLPAITSVANFIKDNLMTAITAMNPAITASKANLEGFASGFKVVSDAIGGAISKLKDFLDWAAKATSAPTPGGAGGGSTVQARAMGGPISAGVPYLVGERGPELIVPKQSGTVIPNNQLGGGAGVTNNYYYSPTYGGTPASPKQDFALMKVLASAGGG